MSGRAGGTLLSSQSQQKLIKELPVAKLLDGDVWACSRASGTLATLHFAFITDDPVIDFEEGSVCGKVYFNARIICHERPHRDRSTGDKNADREYSWSKRWRFTDFLELDAQLRSDHAVPAAAILPKKTFLRHLIPNMEFAKQRAAQLASYATTVLAAAEAQVAADPARFKDVADVSSAWPRFFGMLDRSDSQSDKGESRQYSRRWVVPEGAEARSTAIAYPLGRSVFICNHDRNVASLDSKITKYDKAATLGDMALTHAELRGSAPCSFLRSVSGQGSASGLSSPERQQSSPPHSPPLGPATTRRHTFSTLAISTPESPSLGPATVRRPSFALSAVSTPEASRLPSTLPSPAGSLPQSPRRRTVSDECTDSFSSASTADTDSGTKWEIRCEMLEPPIKAKQDVKVDVVWLELDVDAAVKREQDHSMWWICLDSQRSEALKTQEQAKIPGARQVDGVRPAGFKHTKFTSPKEVDKSVARRKMVRKLESAAAIFRELSSTHEDLHPILGYGSEKDAKSFVVCQQAAPEYKALRAVQFTPQRCHRIVGQALKALSHLHEQLHSHAHLSPESLLIDETPLGPQVRLAWTPGQRREGRAAATLGFRAPERQSGLPGDIWALASIVLAWWQGFSPAPHPWSQFPRSTKLQQDINAALSEDPPQMPQALLELHSSAATAEEPGHTFLSLLASLLTRCFMWEPERRPTAAELVQHPFFEQAL